MSRATRRWAARAPWVVLLLLLIALPASAVRTRSWTAHPATLARGDADGVAITQRGQLLLAPRLSRLGEETLAGDAAQVWSMVSDRLGNLFLGTGPEGRILRISPGGRQSTFFVAPEPLITALAVTGDGTLLAGTAPGGMIYRIDAEGIGDPWAETGERYVWSLVVAPDGVVYAGTGEQGAILSIDASGAAERFFDTGESHVVNLLLGEDGVLLAGGAGRGMVYEVDGDGHGIVRHDDELDEVSGLVAEPDGSVVAALIAAPARESRPPALRLRLPDGVEVGATADSVGTLEEASGPLLHGVIEGLPTKGDGEQRRIRGRLVRIGARGDTTELWSSATEAPYGMVRAAGGRIYFGTGEPARLYTLDEEDEVVLLSTFRESQITGLLETRAAMLLATSNPVAGYRVERQTTDSGVFVSPPFDAGGPARWGSIRWRLEGVGARTELYTRTGNSLVPDDTWSAWSPSMTDPAGSRIDNPDGRFLQWRARFVGGSGNARISDVTVAYANHNRPPEGRDFTLSGIERSVAGEAVFHCTVSDPDDDSVDVTLEYRPATTDDWLAAGDAGEPPDDPLKPIEGWRKKELKWNTDEVPEGPYSVRAVVSDQPANHPGEGHRVRLEPLDVVVDRTAPEMEIRSNGNGTVDVLLSDAHSAIRLLQLREQSGRALAAIRPDDGVCDSRRESFRVEKPVDGGGWILVGVDAAGNTVEQPLQ